MRPYDFHQDAETDLHDIWDYIAKDYPDAADRVTDEIVSAIEALISFPHRGHAGPDLTTRPLRFIVVCANISLPMPRMKSRCGLLP